LLHRLSRHLEQPGTFDRRVALRLARTPLFRVGEGLVDAMANYLRWDDRGQAFALWRVEPGWDTAEGAEGTGVRFNYVGTADLTAAKKALKKYDLPGSALRSLTRRAAALFPPLVEVVYLDTDRRPAEPRLLAALGRQYRAHDKGGSDFNLANDRLSA